MRIVLAPVVLALLAGCVAAPSAPVPPPGIGAPPAVWPIGEDHDHADLSLHQTSWGFERTAHHLLAGSASQSAGAHALDARGSWLFAAAHGRVAEGGVYVFDIGADPLQPKLVGSVKLPGALNGDRSMEATEDGDFIVLGTEALACGADPNPLAPGLYLIDARDKTRPVVVDFKPKIIVHSVSVHRIGGVDHVFALAWDVGDERNVFRIERTPVPRLVPLSSVPIGHDGTPMDDPVLGKPLFYSATGGVEIWDVSDPATPQQLVVVEHEDWAEDYWVHSVVAQWIDGRRILVATSEDGDQPSRMWVFDATDLSDVRHVATWSAPGEPDAEELRYSMHNPRFQGSTLLLSFYHAGLWALDLSTPEEVRIAGVFATAEGTGYDPAAREGPRCGNEDNLPHVWDVEPVEGAVYVADFHTGLYALRPTYAP